MNQFDPGQLAHFIGTEHYYRLTPSAVLTDGTKYLAEAAGAFWLMDAIASYLPQFTGRQCIRCQVAATSPIRRDQHRGVCSASQLIPATVPPVKYNNRGQNTMRLQEFLSADELQQLEQLIYANVYKALATYQQQQRLATIQRQQATTTTAKIKPTANKRKKQLANKAKRVPHVTPAKSLPQPQQQITPTQASTPQSYNPIKSPKPLPAPTRAAIKQPTTPPQGEDIKNFGDVDQAARRMLPPNKRGLPEWELFNR